LIDAALNYYRIKLDSSSISQTDSFFSTDDGNNKMFSLSTYSGFLLSPTQSHHSLFPNRMKNAKSNLRTLTSICYISLFIFLYLITNINLDSKHVNRIDEWRKVLQSFYDAALSEEKKEIEFLVYEHDEKIRREKEEEEEREREKEKEKEKQAKKSGGKEREKTPQKKSKSKNDSLEKPDSTTKEVVLDTFSTPDIPDSVEETDHSKVLVERFSPPSPFLSKPLPPHLIPSFPKFSIVPFSLPPSLSSSSLLPILSNLSFSMCAGFDIGDSSLFFKVSYFYF
jgi:hypothetical protein